MRVTCEDVERERLLERYLSLDLAPEHVDALAAHVEACRECADALALLTQGAALGPAFDESLAVLGQGFDASRARSRRWWIGGTAVLLAAAVALWTVLPVPPDPGRRKGGAEVAETAHLQVAARPPGGDAALVSPGAAVPPGSVLTFSFDSRTEGRVVVWLEGPAGTVSESAPWTGRAGTVVGPDGAPLELEVGTVAGPVRIRAIATDDLGRSAVGEFELVVRP